MNILSFDTSNQALSVALLDNNKLQADFNLTIKKNHSISLMPTIDFLMKQVGWQPSDLDRIVVAQGPGSYTGLRVAVATAKTLAYTLNTDLIGMSSLLSLTLSIDSSDVLVPLIDARRQHAYVGFYKNKKAIIKDCYASIDDIIEQAKSFENITFVGEIDAFKESILDVLPNAKLLKTLPCAYGIGKEASGKASANIDTFIPNYLKKVEAEENWLKTHKEGENDDYIKRI